MPVITWDSSLEIGHETIDAQHRQLVDIINTLHAACTDQSRHSDIKLILLDLYKYVLFHFSVEEALMKACDYAFRIEHEREHSLFVQQLDALAQKARAGDGHVGAETFNWLIGWLLDHISVTDRRLADCLRAR